MRDLESVTDAVNDSLGVKEGVPLFDAVTLGLDELVLDHDELRLELGETDALELMEGLGLQLDEGEFAPNA